MTDIDTMEAGVELDALVAEIMEPKPADGSGAIMEVSSGGWWRCIGPWWLSNKEPSTDWSAAGEVLERMRKQRWLVVLRNSIDAYRCGFVEVPFTQPNGLVCAPAGPLAICRAALKVVRAHERERRGVLP